MRPHRSAATIGLAATLALTATGCQLSAQPHGNSAHGGQASASRPACATGTLSGQGSYAQKLAMDPLISAYKKACPGASISYQATGSDAGVNTFAAGGADFAGTDVPLTESQHHGADAHCQGGHAVEIPVMGTEVDLVANADGQQHPPNLSPAVLAQVFTGKITFWDDPQIKAHNPDGGLKHTPITVITRSDANSETGAFASFLAANAPRQWPAGATGSWQAPVGTKVTGADKVAATVGRTKGAIGFLEGPYKWQYSESESGRNLPLYGTGISLDNNGGALEAGAGSVTQSLARATISANGSDVRLSPDYHATDGQWPLLLVGYEVVCDKGTTSAKLPLLKSFLSFLAGSSAQTILTGDDEQTSGFAALPPPVLAKVKPAISGLG